MGERADPWPTPMLTSNWGKEKSFHIYLVLLLTKYFVKKDMTLGLKPAFSRMQVSRLWFRDGKNWEMLKVRELEDFPLDHPDWTMWVRATPTSVVDLNFRPPSWLGWIKSLYATVNWSLSVITFSMSFPRVLRRTIGWNTFGWLYEVLFGLGMTIVDDILK